MFKSFGIGKGSCCRIHRFRCGSERIEYRGQALRHFLDYDTISNFILAIQEERSCSECHLLAARVLDRAS